MEEGFDELKNEIRKTEDIEEERTARNEEHISIPPQDIIKKLYYFAEGGDLKV